MASSTVIGSRVEIELGAPLPARRTEAELRDVLAERILVLDGATGSALQQRHLEAEDFGGPALEGCNENLVLTRPDVVADLHASYFEAGADMVETNTFGATPIVLAEYGLAGQDAARSIAAPRRSRAGWPRAMRPRSGPRFVAGSIGPTTKAITVTGGITFEELIATFRAQAIGLIEGGVDVLLIETQQDTRNVKAALIGSSRGDGRSAACAFRSWSRARSSRPARCSADRASKRSGPRVSHVPLLSVGLNCATGPEFMTDHLRSLSALAKTFVSCVPNAGLPNPDGSYSETPAEDGRRARALRRRRLGQHSRRMLRDDRGAHRRVRAPRARREAAQARAVPQDAGLAASSTSRPTRTCAR